jgi:hypothetical protein
MQFPQRPAAQGPPADLRPAARCTGSIGERLPRPRPAAVRMRLACARPSSAVSPSSDRAHTRLTQRRELWLIAFGLLIDRHDRRPWTSAIVTTAAGSGANAALKRLINRSRSPIAQRRRSDANGPELPEHPRRHRIRAAARVRRAARPLTAVSTRCDHARAAAARRALPKRSDRRRRARSDPRTRRPPSDHAPTALTHAGALVNRAPQTPAAAHACLRPRAKGSGPPAG